MSTGGSTITGYQVTALQVSKTGAVLSRTVSALQPPKRRSLSMTLPRAGTYRFTVRAFNAGGGASASARSAGVQGR